MIPLQIGTFVVFALLGFFVRNARQERLGFVALFSFVFILGMTLQYLISASAPMPSWVYFTAEILGGIGVGYLTGWLINIRFAKNNLVQAFQLVLTRTASDFRVGAVLLGLLIACAMTFYFAKAYRDHPTGFWEAFYAAWVSGLLFFAVVGLIAGLVTLYRPERDIFLTRVKILLGGKSGTFVDYIAQEIRGIGYIARSIERIVTIEDYDEALNAFKVRVKHTSYITNVLDDVEATAKATFRLELDQFDNTISPLGQVLEFKTRGTNRAGLPLDIGVAGVDMTWEMTVLPGSESTLEYEFWAWYSVTETHWFTPSRFTQALSVEFRSRLAGGRNLMVKLTTSAEKSEQVLTWNEKCGLRSPLTDLKAGDRAYSFQLAVNP